MKNIDEAISHCMQVVESSKCEECRQDHIQLAKWLTELKAYRDTDMNILHQDIN